MKGEAEPQSASVQHHWENVWTTKDQKTVSWYQKDGPSLSLRWITSLPISKTDAIIDIGGATSRFAIKLLGEGFTNVTVNDISEHALEEAKKNAGENKDKLHWMACDVTKMWQFLPSEGEFTVWHDRAVLHFMTTDDDKKNWRKSIGRALKKGGYAIIGTFAIDGPKMCSNLPVEQYDSEKLTKLLGNDFVIEEATQENHMTPAGNNQLFAWFKCRRVN